MSYACRHIGDFGNVESVEGQGINTVVIDHIASLSGPYSIMNRSLIVSVLATKTGLNILEAKIKNIYTTM